MVMPSIKEYARPRRFLLINIIFILALSNAVNGFIGVEKPRFSARSTVSLSAVVRSHLCRRVLEIEVMVTQSLRYSRDRNGKCMLTNQKLHSIRGLGRH